MRILLLLLACISQAQSVIISCSFGLHSSIVIGSEYSCVVNKVQNPEVSELTEILGDHLPNRSNDDVKAFSAYHAESLAYFPVGLESLFPNLVYIQIWGSNLTSISSKDLEPWENLLVLNLNKNRIESLDGDLFQFNPNLQFIGFNENLIRNVGADLLSNLSDSINVRFVNNPCINSYAETSERLDKLKAQLISQCSPTESCKPRCSINDEVDDLRTLLNEQKVRLAHQKKETSQIISDHLSYVKQQKFAEEEQTESIKSLQNLVKQQSQDLKNLTSLIENQSKRIDELSLLANEQAKKIEHHQSLVDRFELNICQKSSL